MKMKKEPGRQDGKMTIITEKGILPS